jgi:chemotaxis signal transduction protein/DNA-binding XRE family transcriptional regulator
MPDDAELLRTARLRAGLTQRQLAERAGTSQAMVARIEGRRQSPSLSTLRRLLDVCGSNIQLKVEGETEGRTPGARAAQARTVRHLVLVMGEARVAVRLDAVREVLGEVSPHRLPAQPPHMVGVALVHGEPLACVDLAGLIGLPPAETGTAAVLEIAGGPVAALVGAADQILDLDAQSVTAVPAGWSMCPALNGLAAAGGEVLGVLDPGRLRLG